MLFCAMYVYIQIEILPSFSFCVGDFNGGREGGELWVSLRQPTTTPWFFLWLMVGGSITQPLASIPSNTNIQGVH